MGLGNESDYTMFGRTLALPLRFSDNLRASIFMPERLNPANHSRPFPRGYSAINYTFRRVCLFLMLVNPRCFYETRTKGA